MIPVMLAGMIEFPIFYVLLLCIEGHLGVLFSYPDQLCICRRLCFLCPALLLIAT